MVQCAALNCTVRTGQGKSMFLLPKDPHLRKKWILNLSRDNFVPSEHTRICEKHFEKNQFNINPDIAEAVGFQPKSKYLVNGAIPTLFDLSEPKGKKKKKAPATHSSDETSPAILEEKHLEVGIDVLPESLEEEKVILDAHDNKEKDKSKEEVTQKSNNSGATRRSSMSSRDSSSSREDQGSGQKRRSMGTRSHDKGEKDPKARQSYIAAFKLECINYAKEYGNRATAREYSITESCVRSWRKQEDLLKSLKATKMSNRPGKKKKVKVLRPIGKEKNREQIQGPIPRQSYTAAFKIECLNYAKENGNHATARKYNIPESGIRLWRKQENLLKSLKATKRANRGKKKMRPVLKDLTETLPCDQKAAEQTDSKETLGCEQGAVYQKDPTETLQYDQKAVEQTDSIETLGCEQGAVEQKDSKETLGCEQGAVEQMRSMETLPCEQGLIEQKENYEKIFVIEPEEEKKDSRPIRTRLSTGSIHMNGTTTIAVAKEIENNSKLLSKESPGVVKKKRAAAIIAEGPVGASPPPKKRKIGRNDGTGEDNRNDYFCWLCHKEGTVVCCELCPRVYHTKCLELDTDLPKEWVCPECEKIMRAECVETRSMSMSIISVDTLCSLLGFALDRMKHQGNADTEPFMKPVDPSSVLHYSDYIFNPMDLAMLEQNIKKKMYGCTEAFLADAKWILHNCVIFNGTHHKLTASAKMIIKICKHEMAEIELCPDCYWNSCVRKNDEWFAELCRSPHTLVWAKLKGYPFWPAKVLREVDGKNVDVRFFGAHDRSLLPTSQVFLLSKNIPTPAKNKKGGFDYSMQELELHIKKLEQKYGNYEYAPFRCPYDRKNVYKEGKFKVSPKKRSSGIKFGPSSAIIQRQKSMNLTSESKQSDKQSALSKTASAVKNKYNSIITTRRASNMGSSAENSPVKGATNCCASSPVKEGTISIDSSSALGGERSPVEKDVKIVTETKTEKVESEETDKDKTASILSRLKTRLQGKIIDSADSKTDLVSEANKDVKASDNQGTADKTLPREEKRKKVLETIQDKLQQIVKDCDMSLSEKSVETNENSASNVSVSENKERIEKKEQKNESVDEKMDVDESRKVEEKLTPSKKDYLSKLQETIKKGKENLGITDDNNELDEDSSSEEDDEDSEEEDDDENEESDESCDERGDEKEEKSDETKDNNKESAKEKNQSTESTEKPPIVKSPTTGTIIEREYETVVKDVLDEATGKITQVKEKVIPKVSDDPCLMMEVDTESDTDKLVIDTDDDRTLSPSPKKAVKKQISGEKSKLSSPKKIVKVVSASSTPTLECAPTTSTKSRPSPPLEAPSQTALNSDFFQSAVEKTLKQKPVIPTTVQVSQTFKKFHDITKTIQSAPSSVSCTTSRHVTIVTPSTSAATKPEETSSRSGLISNFTQKIMGPIQTAFTEFFTQVLEQERESMKKELTKTKEKITEEEEKQKDKSPEEIIEDDKKHWEYSQQITELKYNFRLTCMEMKSSWESEKTRVIDEVKELMKKEKEIAVNETKKKQWCAKCGKEAIFYCCWNTSYCDYPCQQAHWPQHMATCMQQTNENDPNKQQGSATQQTPATNQTPQNSRPNGQPSANKSPMELEQEEFVRRQQEQQHQQFNVQPNGGYHPMHTSPPGSMHNMPMHRQQESPPNSRKKLGWSDQDMNNAVAAVNFGGMSINKASKMYNVPRNKITERISKTIPPNSQPPMMANNQPNPQLHLQYVQPPQPMSSMSLPPSVQTFSTPPQMRMPGSQPVLTNMLQNPQQPVMSQNNSILFPVQLRPTQPAMNIPPGMMQPGQLLISQGAQPPRPPGNMMPRTIPFHGRY